MPIAIQGASSCLFSSRWFGFDCAAFIHVQPHRLISPEPRRCACDYDAHNYTFSWDQKADWTSVYAGAEEVQHYFEDFARKHGLHEYCKFGTTVKRAQWDDATGRWGLQLQTTGGPEWEESFDILINASGLLSSPKWPEIPGLDEFGGLLLHSAAWPARPVELKGKHVGLIGNG